MDIKDIFGVITLLFAASIFLAVLAFKSLYREFKDKASKNAFYKIAMMLSLLELIAVFLGFIVMVTGADFLIIVAFVLSVFELYPLYPYTVYLPLTSGLWLAAVVYAKKKRLPTPSYVCSLIVNLYPALMLFFISHSFKSFTFLVILTGFGWLFLKEQKRTQ